MKTNQRILFIVAFVILLLILICGIYFGINKPSNNPSTEKDDTTKEEDKNISIIKEELNLIIDYLNGEKSDTTNNYCALLSTDIGYNITSSEDFFSYYAALIMGCIHNKEYSEVSFDYTSSSIIINDTQYKELVSYFEQDFNLKVYDEEYLKVTNDDIISELNNYYNKGYKIFFEYGGLGISETKYKLSRIINNKDSYEVTIIATFNNQEYTGTMNVKIVDNHCKYSKLIFKKS